MPGNQSSIDPEYFVALYRHNDDPWNFAGSGYEAAKYATTIAALPAARYGSAFEIGCSIGILTAMLAKRCDALLAVDVSDRALELARLRCSTSSHVRFAAMAVPKQFPSDTFDLIVLSEVGYFWSRPDLALARDRMIAALRPQGIVLLVHWTPPVSGHPVSADEVHETFLTDGRLKQLQGRREERYRLDVCQKT
ncbi:MAG: methyltransferase domain-containing protein [Candidatus Eremiobacteraeota bacterium]|nr:methyltransferase domain-containing protein [Candidatus Eremiobacteraeota bacterium]MBC5827811.1 methyltransferase domain-containing protein [Candidatus Eremiobacteraeota bacterium]